MDRRNVRLLPVLVLAVSLVACQRAKPERILVPLAGSRAGASLQFELHQPPAQATERIERGSLVVKQDNCASSTAMEKLHRETVTLGPSYELGAAEGNLDLAAHKALMGEIVLRRYQVQGEAVAEGEVMLRTAGGARSEFVLRWDETWDRNSIDVIRDGQVIDSVPVKVRLGAELVLVSSREEPCVAPSTGTPAKAHLPIVGSVPVTTTASAATPSVAAKAPSKPGMTAAAMPSLTATPSPTNAPVYRPTRTVRPTRTLRPTWTPRPARGLRPTRTLTPSITPMPSSTPIPSALPAETMEPSATIDGTVPRPGSEEGIAVVRDYIGYLKAREWHEAYNLLDETFQKRMSFDSFVKGYEGVVDIELYGIECTWIDERRESVRAIMTIRTLFGERDWMGSYEVVTTPGKEPYERRIISASLNRLPPGTEARRVSQWFVVP
jgi:hypothetical protein